MSTACMFLFRAIPLVSLLVLASPRAEAADVASSANSLACAGGYASTFRLAGAVHNPRTYSLEALQSMPSSRLTVSWYSGRDGMVTETYTGVPLIDLLDEADVIVDPNQHNDILRFYLVATATDCYQTTVALGEILPTFGGEQAIVAYADGDGVPLGTDEGMARLILPNDKAGGREIFNLSRILVRSPGPAPQSAE